MPASVVVIHDDAAIREAALAALRLAGLDAVGFAKPLEALDAIEADSRARVLVTRVDFGSGEVNGVALARMVAFKRLASNDNVKVVFVDRPEYHRASQDIANAFLSLPLDPATLVMEVRRALSSL